MVKTLSVKINKKKINLYSINDVHLGAKNFMKQEFRDYIETIRKDKNAYVILNGDYIDAIRPGDPRFNINELDFLYSDIDKQYKAFKEIIKPIKDKIIAIGNGNHEDAVRKYYGWNVTRMLGEAFDVPVFEDLLVLKLKLKNKLFRILVIHGIGNTITISGQISKLIKYATQYLHASPDIILMGHTHRLDVILDSRLNDDMKTITQYRAICGSFLKTYIDGESNYGTRKLYPPLPIGYIWFSLDCEGNIKDNKVVVN